jgi:hypothetical protein
MTSPPLLLSHGAALNRRMTAFLRTEAPAGAVLAGDSAGGYRLVAGFVRDHCSR